MTMVTTTVIFAFLIFQPSLLLANDSSFDTSLNAECPVSPLFVPVDGQGQSGPMLTDSIFGPLHPPVQVISFQDDPYNHNMGIASDGNYYYTVNGGSAPSGMINVYDLQGNFISTNPINLDMRGIVYNRSDGYFYLSTYTNTAIYKILSVSAGTYQLVFANILMNNQGSIGISWDGQYFFDHYNGTVHKINAQTGTIVQTLTGFSYGTGNYGGNCAITADPDYLYTWNAVTRQLYIYTMNGTPVQTYTLPNGDNGMSLSFIDGNIFVSNDANYGIGTWFGFNIRDYEAQNVTVTMTPVGLPIQIPANGGSFNFNIAVANNETSPVTFQVWTMATLPNGSEYGPIINSFVTMNGSSSGNRDRTQNVPATAPSGNYTYDAYVGFYPSNAWDEDHFDFSKAAVTDGGAGVSDWMCWGASFSDEMSEPAAIVPVSNVYVSSYPNPFNPVTTLSFELPDAGFVNLAVYDISGREVSRLLNGFSTAGIHEVTFDGKELSGGVYFAKLQVGDAVQTRKLLLVK